MSYDRFCRLYPLPHGAPDALDDACVPPLRESKLRRTIWLVTILFAASMFALVAAAAQAAPHTPLDAVVMVRAQYGENLVGGGSGVVISPDGLVLTAEHVVGTGEIQSVTYRGKDYPAKAIFNPEKNGIDEAFILQFNPPFPTAHLPIAKAAPRVGDVVYSFGYPSLSYYSANIGEVTSFEEHGEVRVNFWVLEGNSGGPLLNASGEVVGLASTRDPLPGSGFPNIKPGSTWIGLPSIQAAVNRQRPAAPARPAATRGELLYFSATWCGPCQQMLPIVERLKHQGQPIRKVDCDKERDLAQRYGIRSVPAFVLVVDGKERSRAVGMQSEATLRQMLSQIPGGELLEPYQRQSAATIEDLFKDPPTPPPVPRIEIEPGAPRVEINPAKEAEPVIDWSLVKIVVLRSNPELKKQTGAVIAALQDQLGGPFRRRLQEVTGGRADIKLVHEQASPARYAAVRAAVGREPGSMLVVVMTKQQDLGLVKGTIAAQVQSALAGFIEGKVPVEIVSERVHPRDYVALEAALLTTEPVDPAEDAPWWIAGVSSIVSLIVGYVLSYLQKKRKANADAQAETAAQ